MTTIIIIIIIIIIANRCASRTGPSISRREQLLLRSLLHSAHKQQRSHRVSMSSSHSVDGRMQEWVLSEERIRIRIRRIVIIIIIMETVNRRK